MSLSPPPVLDPNAPFAAVDDRQGLQLLRLFTEQQSWVHRRVETIRFHDDASVRREVSVDLTVRSDAPVIDLIVPAPSCLIPLAQFKKRNLTNFDLWDESSKPLPVLSAMQNQAVIGAGIAGLGEQFLSQPLDASVRDDLRAVVGANPAEVARARSRLLFPEERDAALEQRLALLDDEDFAGLVRLFADNFFLVTIVDFEPGRRRILKFGYDTPFDIVGDRDLWSRVQKMLGLAATRVVLPVPSVWAAQSYHVELALPPEVRSSDALLAVDFEDAPVARERPFEYGDRVHLSVADVPPGAEGEVVVELSVSRRGWLTACLYATAVVAVVQGLVATRLRSIVGPDATAGEGSVSLILALVGVLTGLATRRAEHALASRLLSRLRFAVALSGFLAYVLGTALVVGWPGGEVLVWAWRVAAVLAVATVLLVGWSYLVAERRTGVRTTGPGRW